ncbi:hypothetical protein [uncultured Aquimarina sp.]|uniref:hypothetical protein n=1 Tax=uncultured Aquimarina sp. TaxID=575652 RepID=UPI002622D9AC|nr:hypothetical protein [uncultured Aquimarina sp.]
MTPEEFVQSIVDLVVKENLEIYKNLFNTTNKDSTRDLYWKEVLTFYQGLDESKRQVLFKIIKQIQIDTISNIFGILDGNSMLEGQLDDFDLEYNGQRLNDDLQSMLIEITEE